MEQNSLNYNEKSKIELWQSILTTLKLCQHILHEERNLVTMERGDCSAIYDDDQFIID